MPLPIERKIRRNAVYCGLVALVALFSFSILSGFLGFTLSWFFRNTEQIEQIKRIPGWQSFSFLGVVLFIISNFCLYYSELFVESFVEKVKLSRFGAALFVFLSIFFSLSWVYFGFSFYFNWLNNQFWIY
jgi:hypothetical protein